MEFLTISTVNIIWILYSLSEGMRESFFDYYKFSNRRKSYFDIKRIFLAQRLLFLLILTIVMSSKIGLLSIFLSLGQIFMFKYFHRISYDISSKKIDSNINQVVSEYSFLRKMNKHKNFLLFSGITLQIFIYTFIL